MLVRLAQIDHSMEARRHITEESTEHNKQRICNPSILIHMTRQVFLQREGLLPRLGNRYCCGRRLANADRAV